MLTNIVTQEATHETSPVSSPRKETSTELSQIENAPPIVTPPYTPPHTPPELSPPPAPKPPPAQKPPPAPKLEKDSQVEKVYNEILSVVMKNILGNILHNIKNLDNFLHDICYSKCLIILLLIRLLTIFLYDNYDEDINIINNILILIYLNESAHEPRTQIFKNIKYDITDLIYDYTYIYIKEEEEREGDRERKKEAEADVYGEEDGENPKKKKKVRETKQVSEKDKLMMKIYNNVDFALIIINDMVLRYFHDCWKYFLYILNNQQLQNNTAMEQGVSEFIENEKIGLIRVYSRHYDISDICNDYYDMSQDKKNSLYSIRMFCPVKTTTSIEMVDLYIDDADVAVAPVAPVAPVAVAAPAAAADADVADADVAPVAPVAVAPVAVAAPAAAADADVADAVNTIVVQVAKEQEHKVIAILYDIYNHNHIQSLTGDYTDLKSISLQILISELNNNIKRNIERNDLERRKLVKNSEVIVRQAVTTRMKAPPNQTRTNRMYNPLDNKTKTSRKGAIEKVVRQGIDIQGPINKKIIEIIIEFDRAINLYKKYNFDEDEKNNICITIKNIINHYGESLEEISSLQRHLTKIYNKLKQEWSTITKDVLGHSHTIQYVSEVFKPSRGGKSLKKITNRKTRKRKNRKSRKHKNKRSKNNKNKRHFKIRSYKL